MSATQAAAATLAADLPADEQAALLVLRDGEWTPAPAADIGTRLAFHHGIPLATLEGGNARPTRFGLAVQRELQRRAEGIAS